MLGSFHFNHYFGPFAFARVKNNGAFRLRLPARRTTAMRVALKTEFAPAKLSPQKKSGDRSHNRQRNGLLPIHAVNIRAKTVRATDFRQYLIWWGEATDEPSSFRRAEAGSRGRSPTVMANCVT